MSRKRKEKIVLKPALTAKQIETYKANRIPEEIVNHRIMELKWTIQDAITKPSKYKNLTPEQTRRYKEIDLSYTTVMNRIKKLGWSVEKAITTLPTRNVKKREANRDQDGTFKKKNKGKSRTIHLTKDVDELVDKAIAESDLTQSDYIAQGFMAWFQEQQQRA